LLLRNAVLVDVDDALREPAFIEQDLADPAPGPKLDAAPSPDGAPETGANPDTRRTEASAGGPVSKAANAASSSRAASASACTRSTVRAKQAAANTAKPPKVNSACTGPGFADTSAGSAKPAQSPASQANTHKNAGISGA